MVRIERAVSIVKNGTQVLEKLLLVGEAVPMLGNVCQVSRTILIHVQKLADKVDDVLEMGQRLLDALKYLDRMGNNMKRFPATNELRECWSELHTVLTEIEGVVASFSCKG